VRRAKRQAILVILAVLLLVVAIIVWVTSHSLDIDLLAAGAIIGGIAVMVVSLPENGNNGNHK
jgi:hypothetical protein